MTSRSALLALFAPLLLAACGGEPNLMNFNSTRTPNEFLVVPAKPLQTPPNVDVLPPPNPGAANRADATPLADAVVALGGKASALKPDGSVPGSDGMIVNYASRYGRDIEIRDKLESEDLAYRQSNQGRLLERVFNVNRYFDSYDNQSLDQQQEIDRLRAAGVPTPSAPPAALKPQ